jgi:phage antirepressor YoqD-like protein
MAHNTQTYGNKDLATKLQADPTLEMAALYARIDEIKQKRISELEAANNALTAQNTGLKAANEILAPKAEIHDALVSSDHLTNFLDTAKEIHVPVNTFMALLIKYGFGYRDNKGDFHPYAEYVHTKRYFEEKDYLNKNNGHTSVRAFITFEGKAYFLKRFSVQTMPTKGSKN